MRRQRVVFFFCGEDSILGEGSFELLKRSIA